SLNNFYRVPPGLAFPSSSPLRKLGGWLCGIFSLMTPPPSLLSLLAFVTYEYPNEVAIIPTASAGPSHSGIISVPARIEYDTIAATDSATPLSAYDRYLKPFVLNILENADRSTKLSSVSSGIIP